MSYNCAGSPTHDYTLVVYISYAMGTRGLPDICILSPWACGPRLWVYIKTHDSESRGQKEAGRTRRTSELFTRSTALKFVNALNKPP